MSYAAEGTNFMPVIGDDSVNAAKVKKVLICSGQFYYALKIKRDELQRDVLHC